MTKNKKTTGSETMTFTIPVDVAERFREKCRRENRVMSGEIADMMREYTGGDHDER